MLPLLYTHYSIIPCLPTPVPTEGGAGRQYSNLPYLFLEDQHGVAIAVKTVSFFNGFLIDSQDKVSACKSRNQHDQRRFGKMEVGHQSIYHPERVGWMDEKRSVSSSWFNPASPFRERFKGAGRRRSNGDHSSSPFFSLINLSCDFFRYLHPLFFHRVFFNLFCFYRSESAWPDVKGDKCDPHPLLL